MNSLFLFLTEISSVTSEVVESVESTATSSAVIDSAAVDQLLEWINQILNTQIATIGGTTLTIGLLLFAVLKYFFPKNAIISNQESTIDELEKENAELKKQNEEMNARVMTLEAQMDVVTTNTPNKRVRDAKNISISPAEAKTLSTNVTKIAKEQKEQKKVKVKVKAPVTEAVDNG